MLRLRQQKKESLLVVAMLAMLLSLTACESGTPTSEVVYCKTTPVRPTPIIATPVLSACDRPAPPGATVLVDEMAIQVNAVVRPADGLVAVSTSPSLSPAGDYTFILVSLSITCKRDDAESCSIAPLVNFRLQTDAGETIPQIDISGVPGLLELESISGGETVYGGVMFEIEEEESELILIYQGDSGNDVCFVVPTWTSVAAVAPPSQPTRAAPTATPQPSATPTVIPTPTSTAFVSPLSTPVSPLETPVSPLQTPTPDATASPTPTNTPTPTVVSTPVMPVSGRPTPAIGLLLVAGMVLVVVGSLVRASYKTRRSS